MNSLRGVLILDYYRFPGQQAALLWKRATSPPPKRHLTVGYSSPQPLIQLHTLKAVTLMLFQRVIDCHLLQPKHKPRALIARHVRHPHKEKVDVFTSKTPLHVTRDDGQNLLKPSPSSCGITPSLPSIGNILTKSSQVFVALLTSSHRRHGSQLLEVLLDSDLLDPVDSPARAQQKIAKVSTLF